MPRFEKNAVVRIKSGSAEGRIGRVCNIGGSILTVAVWLGAPGASDVMKIPLTADQLEPASGEAPPCT